MALVLARQLQKAPLQYIFIPVYIFFDTAMLKVQAMIDYGLTWNLILQHLVRENKILGNNKGYLGLKTLDGNLFQIYQNHFINVWVTASNRKDSIMNQPILEVNMKSSI